MSELARVVLAQVERRSLPLKRPYVLSFVTLERFETVLLRLHLDTDVVLLGEVVPLPGYASETVEDVVKTVEAWLPKFSGQELGSLRQTVANQLALAPFASSLVLSAIDSQLLPSLDQREFASLNVPLVYPTASTKPELEQLVEQAIAAGYSTIKVKVGESLEHDLQALPRLKRAIAPNTRVRFDANQGYTVAEAHSFLSALDTHLPDQTELVEQPLPPDAWNDMAQLCGNTAIPLMLDESIYTVEDVDRAAAVGCRWVKLKLCKQGGAQEIVQQASYAKQLGLNVVIGNGVATDVSNLLELWLYHCHPDLFDGASESNGFEKLQQPVLHHSLYVKAGCAMWK